jgi:hypothetical protein
MASKHSTRKNTSGPNQPPSREVKDLVSNKPLEFPTSDPSRLYSTHIPSQSTPDLTYTSSPETPNPNQDPSLNEYLHGVTPEEPVYRIQITMLISSTDRLVFIFNLSVKFPLYTKFQDLVLLIEELIHTVRTRL